MDPRLFNGKPKATAIVRFDHQAILIGEGRKKWSFSSLEALLQFAHRRGYEVNVTHLHPAGAFKG